MEAVPIFRALETGAWLIGSSAVKLTDGPDPTTVRNGRLGGPCQSYLCKQDSTCFVYVVVVFFGVIWMDELLVPARRLQIVIEDDGLVAVDVPESRTPV